MCVEGWMGVGMRWGEAVCTPGVPPVGGGDDSRRGVHTGGDFFSSCPLPPLAGRAWCIHPG